MPLPSTGLIGDAYLGIAPETVYGTYVAPTRFYEFVDENVKLDKTIIQGRGLRQSSRVARSARRVLSRRAGSGDFSVEIASKGFGLLWQAAMGTATWTVIPASTAGQENFTLGPAASSLMPSISLQKGLVRADAAGNIKTQTYLGATIPSFDISCGSGEIATAKFTVDARDLDTSKAAAAVTYAAEPVTLFNYLQATMVLTVGGTFVKPTTTALATLTSGTAVGNVESFQMTVNNNFNADRFVFGSGGAVSLKSNPTSAMRDVTGAIDVQYSDDTLRDAILAETPLQLLLTFTNPNEVLNGSAGNATFQIALPEIKLDGDVPDSNGTDMIIQNIKFTVLDNLTAAQEPLYLVHRTADSAL